ncbi:MULTISPECIES: cation transporter [unclassified Variovorax]|uniref:cation transporter n=1 Tax=unclassified Variovorax TaxID=663243 RepID=UPI00076D74A2|nr:MULTISPECIES: cation transporter [unclassified Variovorax]KWT72499.1 Cobalt-zinc-cadmium resistance protein CzcD [Variovorax sp. WDL1]PNG47463.1 Cadmium, cobalt and zinc/H(+)-K(+) antiporter [Variovorax sp. B2]PNG47886.1 Cadmium, cobalt and zinc/H(+)-K(+) antiporter [Variovorax sp. B4]VTV15377.1 Cadmium, cobalt and zinc/H(+)-K(+) antiporter [Variovorax sp. WDL1]
MSANCCEHDHDHEHLSASDTPRYRRVLWVALALNALMFVVEIGAGFRSGSVSLLADAIDFFGDAANYGVTLAVLSMGLAWRARAAVLKGLSMLGFGFFVAGKTFWSATQGLPPEALTMGLIGALALGVNVAVALLLYAFREGDANMRSVWLCSRNDAIGNVAVMLAALGVFGTGSAWPDLAVAAVMAALALSGGWSVLRQARGELGRADAAQARRA